MFYQNVFFPKIDELGIKQIIHLGDIVDRRKLIDFVSLNHFHDTFVQPIIDRHINLDVIIGNHDIPYRHNNHINAMSELYGDRLINIKHHPDPVEVMFDDNCKFLFIPWINNSNQEQSFKMIKESDAEVLLGHLDIQGFQMHAGHVSEAGLTRDMFSKYGLVCSGHFHHRSSIGNIMYLGNPYELTWNDYNSQRGFHIFDTETAELEFIQNPYRMYHKIQYDDVAKSADELLDKDFSRIEGSYVKVIVTNKKDPYLFDTVLEKMHTCNPERITIVDDNMGMDDIKEDDMISQADETIDVLMQSVDSMDINNKPEVKALLHVLHQEAQELEI